VSDEQDTTVPEISADDVRPEPARPDPRLRPPDPAGTRPEFDPDGLLPQRTPAAATGTLWAPPRDGEDDQHGEEHDPDDREVAADAAPVAAVAADEPERLTHSRYSPRFQFFLGGLLAVGAAAIVLTVAMLVGSGRDDGAAVDTGPQWSAWRPLSGGAEGASEIATHVGRAYRMPGGKQLVAVTGGALEIADLPLTVAIRQTAAQGGDIQLYDGSGVLFRMCGLGPQCSIAEGKPSTKRHLLLRREALELALYSFHYLGVSEAVVFLPPPKGEAPSQALFFRRGDQDVATAVARPLDATLVPKTPTVAGVTRSPDAGFVNTLTLRQLFKFSLTQGNQDARAYLVLDPPPK
jgi:hypothetical protein